MWARESSVLPPSSMKLEAVCCSEMLVPTFRSIQHHNLEDHHGHLHCCENLKWVTSSYLNDWKIVFDSHLQLMFRVQNIAISWINFTFCLKGSVLCGIYAADECCGVQMTCSLFLYGACFGCGWENIVSDEVINITFLKLCLKLWWL
jgi:hypothetical protein